MSTHTHDLWNIGPGVLRGISRGGTGQDGRQAFPDARQAWIGEYQKVSASPEVRRLGAANAGVAVIRIDGPVVGDPQWWYEGRNALTHSAVAAAVLAAANDPTVAKIALELNCPGWNASESDLTIDAVTKAAAIKPVVARAYGCALSGGLWMAALCSEVSAARESLIGSVGAMVVLYDDSARFKREGIEANVFAFPSIDKAAGVPGVPLTEAARQNVQGIVDANGKRFVAAVAAGRKISAEAVIAMNAAVMTAEAAKAAGLIDVIETQEAWESRVSAAPGVGRKPPQPAPSAPSVPSSRAKENPVDFSTLTIEDLREKAPELVAKIETAAEAALSARIAAEAAAPATFAQLKEIHRGDTAAIVASQEAGHTTAQARAARDAAVAARLKTLEDENAALRDQSARRAGDGAGVEPVGVGARDRSGTYADAVKAVRAADGVAMPVAMHRAALKNPEAYRRWKAEGCPAIV